MPLFRLPSLKKVPGQDESAQITSSPGTCKNCNRRAFSTVEFEAECAGAGFVKDAATGKFQHRMFITGITDEALWRTFGPSKQREFDEMEGQRGFRCQGCGEIYCMNCLYAVALGHPSGGKACPKCGSKFDRYE